VSPETSRAVALAGVKSPQKAARLLRAVMDRAGVAVSVDGAGSAGGLEALLGAADPRLTSAEQEALWLARAAGSAPIAAFARLFVFGETLARADARALFADDLPAAEATGLLRTSRTGVAATLSLSLHEGLPVFADAVASARASEHVPGPTRATLVLDGALPPSPVKSALELGTGPGYLALRLCARARAVTATDVSPRALAFAALNAAVHGVRNLTLVRSDRFAALAQPRPRRFDLVVGNLPFVVAPTQAYVFRDSGLAEDGFVASVVSGVGRHLQPGGLALLLGQWVHKEDEPEDQRLAPWFVAAGCDALVLRLDAEPADVYAARWSAGPRGDLDRAARASLLERWLLHLRRARIRGVSTGLFVLRRRPGRRHVMSIDDVDTAAPPPRWPEIATRLAALDG
jgi:methylase of polypeptide subunit release factors